MFPGRVPPPIRATSAASGDFDPESPRRNSQTGEFGPTPVNTFAPPPTAIQHNPLFNNAPGGHPPSRLPPPPRRSGSGGSQELPATGSGFQRPSSLQQPGFLAGLPMPSVPRTSSWAMKGPNEGTMGATSLGGAIGGQNRPPSNAPSPTVLSPTQGNLMASNNETPSAFIQVSQPNVGMPYAPQRGGSGSPSMTQAAQQYAAFPPPPQQQQQPQQQINHQEQLHYEQQQNQQHYAEHEQMQDPTATGTGDWTQQQEPEMAQMYGNNEETQTQNQEGGYRDQGYEGYAAAGVVPEMMADPAEQYNEQQQYYDNQHFPQERQYDGNVAYDDTNNGVDGADNQSNMAHAANRKLPPPAVSFESPIKAKFARGAAHSSARAGALAGAFNNAATTAGLPQLPPPPSPPLQPPQGLPQMPIVGADEDDGHKTGAGMNENQMTMHGFSSGGFAGRSVASAPAGEESGNGGNNALLEQQQQGEETATTEAEAPLPPLPPPPMMGAPGGMVGGGSFPTFGSKPVLPRNDSNHSQPGSARSTGNGPPQFGTLLSANTNSGVFMAGNNNNNNAVNRNNSIVASKGSVDGISGHQMGIYQQTGMTMPPQPGSRPESGGGGSTGDLQRTFSSPKAGQQQQRKDSSHKPRKQRRRGIGSVLLTISLVLTLSAALSVGTTIVAVTFAANMTHAAISGLGSMAHGASLSSAIAKMHPAAIGIAKHVDEVSQAQWLATERSLRCDESNSVCRGTRWALHSARLGGILAKDGAISTASHAPHLIRQTAVPAVHFTKQQSALLFDQLKGMKSSQGRDAVVAAVHQSAEEVKTLGQDLFAWVHCVYQHLSQSGVHSIHHVVEPAAGCWEEIMGHYYLPDDGRRDDIVDVASGIRLLEEMAKEAAAAAADVVKEKEVEEREIAAPIENVEAEKTEEGVLENETVEQAEESQEILPEAAVEEEKKQEEQQEVEASPGSAASSPMLLEEEEEQQEIVKNKVDDQEFDSGVAAEAVGAPPPVETEKLEEEVYAPATHAPPPVGTDKIKEEVYAPASANAPNATTTDVSAEVEIKDEIFDTYESIVEVAKEDRGTVDKVEKHVVEEVKEVPPPSPSVVPDVAAELKVEGEQEQHQEEESVNHKLSEVVVEDTATTSRQSSEIPKRYASAEEYMMGHEEPAVEEKEEAAEEEAAAGSGIDDVEDKVADQGPPEAFRVSETTAEQATQKTPLWSVKVVAQEIENKLAGVVNGAVDFLRAHHASVVAALGAAGGTAIFFFAANALAAHKAALAARQVVGAGAQPLTPHRPSSAAEEAPATVFKSARSKRKTKTVITTVDEEGDGLLKNRSRQSAPARLAAPAFEQEEAVEEEAEVKPRGRKSSRGGASRGRSRSRGGTATTSRGRTATTTAGASGSSRGGRKASISRRRSTKATA